MYKYFFGVGILALALSFSGCAAKQDALAKQESRMSEDAWQDSLAEEYEEEEEIQEEMETQEKTKTIADTSDRMQVTVDINGSYEREYYQDTAAFLAAYGIEKSEPDFYYNNIDGRRQLALYFNEATGLWCGIRDFYNHDADLFARAEPYGFVFEEQERREWDASELYDISIDGCRLLCANVEEYQENFTYDEEGRTTQFQVRGINGAVPEEGVQLLLQIDYSYREDGTLLHRAYAHSTLAFETWQSRRDTYFDALERVTFEDVYITHGNMEYYFFYQSDKPDFDTCLILDYNTGDWYGEWVDGICKASNIEERLK